MAALNVVHHRLHRVGLGPICLQLHSRGANKRLVLAELDETLNQGTPMSDAQFESERLKELRDTLNAVDKRMHTPVGETGMLRSPRSRDSSLLEMPALLATPTPACGSRYVVREPVCFRRASGAGALGDHRSGRPFFQHPYFGIHASNLQPAELARMAPRLTALAKAASELAENVAAIAIYIGISSSPRCRFAARSLRSLRLLGRSRSSPQSWPRRSRCKTRSASSKRRTLVSPGRTSKRPTQTLTWTPLGIFLPCR